MSNPAAGVAARRDKLEPSCHANLIATVLSAPTPFPIFHLLFFFFFQSSL